MSKYFEMLCRLNELGRKDPCILTYLAEYEIEHTCREWKDHGKQTVNRTIIFDEINIQNIPTCNIDCTEEIKSNILMENGIYTTPKLENKHRKKIETWCINNKIIFEPVSKHTESQLVIIRPENHSTNRLMDIEKKLQSIQDSTENMDRHIHFIEGIWEIIRSPFNRILSYMNEPMVEDQTGISDSDISN